MQKSISSQKLNCATLENRFLGTFLLFNGAKSLGTQPKHVDGVPDLTNDSEPAFRRLALLKAGSEGRPRNFRRFPPLTAASQSTVFHTITTTPIFNLNLTCTGSLRRLFVLWLFPLWPQDAINLAKTATKHVIPQYFY